MAGLFMSLSKREMFSRLWSDARFSFNVLSTKEYNGLWTKIKEELSASLREENLVFAVESGVNSTLWPIVYSKDGDFNYVIGVDNDKVHFKITKSTVLNGLWAQRHVRDNRYERHVSQLNNDCILTFPFQNWFHSPYFGVLCHKPSHSNWLASSWRKWSWLR